MFYSADVEPVERSDPKPRLGLPPGTTHHVESALGGAEGRRRRPHGRAPYGPMAPGAMPSKRRNPCGRRTILRAA
jgi:hypothetical protein